MIIHPSTVAIIADDLTGANDSALQFQQQGAAVQILLDTKNEPGQFQQNPVILNLSRLIKK